jgi:hypothetical protein
VPGVLEPEELEPLVILVVAAGHGREIVPPAAGGPRRRRSPFVAGPTARPTSATGLTSGTLARSVCRSLPLARSVRRPDRRLAIFSSSSAAPPPARLAGPLFAAPRFPAAAIRRPGFSGLLPRLGRTHAVAGRHRRVVVEIAALTVSRGLVGGIAARRGGILRKPFPSRARTPAAATTAPAAAGPAFLVAKPGFIRAVGRAFTGLGP